MKENVNMVLRVAVAGKGGVGKTTFTSLFVSYLLQKKMEPVLVVDADPNSNLSVYLGAHYEATVSDVREDLKSEKIPTGFSKAEYLELRIREILSENRGYDLLVMGRPEGPGCYCFVNELLRTALSKLSSQYEAVVIDNEAGLEHLSRRTTDNLDYLYIVSTPNIISLKTALHIKNLACSLKLKIKNISAVLNRVKSDEQLVNSKSVLGEGLEISAVIPEFPNIAAGELIEKNVFNISFPYEILKNLLK